MPRMLDPFEFLLVSVAGWMNQRRQQAIEYLREENRVLREQLGDRRVRFNEPAPPVGGPGQRLRSQAPGRGRQLSHARYPTRVAPKADCPEVRWAREA